MGNVSEQAFGNDLLACLHEVWRTSTLSANLHHAVVLSGGGEHCLTLYNIDARRFLDIHIATSLDSSDHR